jgi:hypothetical protein
MIKNLISNATSSPQIKTSTSLLSISSTIPFLINYPFSINLFRLETPVITSLLTGFFLPPKLSPISL